jgi:hypothetical protein
MGLDTGVWSVRLDRVDTRIRVVRLNRVDTEIRGLGAGDQVDTGIKTFGKEDMWRSFRPGWCV